MIFAVFHVLVTTFSRYHLYKLQFCTFIIHNNRYDVLAITDDERSDGGPFAEQRSARVKRRRQASAQHKQQQQQQWQATGDVRQQSSAQRARVLTVFGKSVIAGVNVAAAKPICKKAVFCVDNVGTSYTVNDITSFVSSLAVPVLSCYQVKPCRRCDEEGEITDRIAFHVCIWAEDQDRMLDASKWPKSIAISQWFRKQSSTASADKRRRDRSGLQTSSCRWGSWWLSTISLHADGCRQRGQRRQRRQDITSQQYNGQHPHR